MKKTLLLITLLVLCGGAVFSQVILNPISGDPVVYTGWTLAGSANPVNVDSAIQLTPSSLNQSGRVYYSTAESVTTCGEFSVNFDFRIIPPATGVPADGIAFFFLSSPVGAASTGAALDIPPNPNGLVLIFDTYDNNGDGLNPEIPIYGYNGTVGGYTEGSAARRLGRLTNQNFVDDGAWHHCLITYNAGTIKVFFNYSAAPSFTVTYPLTVPGQFGFSGSTGGSVSNQEVKNVYIRSNTISPILGNLSICRGATTALSDSTTGGTWTATGSGSVVAGTGVVTGTAVGTAGITYTFGTCTSTAIVTVNTQPVAITGSGNICLGSTSLLSDATAGGVWTSVTTGVATAGTDGTISGALLGTSTVSYTIGSCAATKVVTVDPNPVAITGTGIVCQGLTTALTDLTGGGTWLSGSTGIATVGAGTGIVTGGSTSGTANITYTITSTGCYTVAAVTVNPTPAAITGTLNVCVGSITNLTDVTASGTWSSTGTATVSATGAVTGVSPGTATITYALATGCIQTAIVTVNPIPVPITGNTPVCQTFSINLSDATGGGVWSSVTTSVAAITAGGVVTGGAVGTSVISYTIGTSCFVTTTVTVNTQPAAVTGTASVCEGAVTALTDATGGGIWSSTATGIATVGTDGTVTASTSATGTTTISYLLGSCVATQVVTVNTQPAAITGNAPVCQTFSVTLSDATLGGTWSSVTTTVAAITAGGVVTGGAAGTSVISYAIGSCFVTAIVTVNTQPAAIMGIASACEGSTTALTDATSGGVWSSTTTGIATVGTDGTVTASSVATGTSTISYLLGSCVATQVVTVNTQPVAITGNTPVCQTFSITLSDGTTGGVWASTTTSVAVITAGGIVTAGAAGTSTISYTIGSCFVTDIVTVNPTPGPITGTLSVCAGSATDLTDIVTPGGTWSSIGTATVSATGSVTGISPGTAIITYALATGCIQTVIVTVNAQPVAITGNTPICQTFSITLSDATGGGTWTSVTTSVAVITAGGTVTGGGTGTSTISYTLGSCFATTVVTVNTQPVAITGGSATLCQGATTALTDVTGGGIWSSTATGVATVGTDGTVTASTISTGTSTISYTIGSCATTEVVTVTTLPAAITGNTGPICQTFSIQLSDATGGGTWSSVTTIVANITGGGLVTGGNTGTSTISYTIAGCAATTVITVNTQPTAILGSTAVCQGFTISLSDGTAGGNWSSTPVTTASVSPTGVVTGVAVGTATITYTLGSCFTTLIVTVTTQPAAITGNTGPICQTFSIQLSDATGGGAWSSVTTTVANITGGGLVTGGNTGTSTISYAVGSCAVTTVVTVDLQPAIITGSLSVCQGLTTALSDATGGGTWSSVNPGTGSISVTGVVTGVAVGTATISYTVGICAAEAIVTVNSLPAVITGTKTVCSGLTTSLFDGTGGGTWSSSNSGIASIGSSTGIVTGGVVLVTSTATITYTVGSGCINTTVVTVNPLPTAILGANAVCLGSTITLSDGGGGTWLSGNTGIATVTGSVVVMGAGVGVTTITYTLPTGCHITTPMTVNPVPLAITGPTLVCVGSSITLSDATPLGTWSSSNTGFATVIPGTGVVTGQGGGVVTISYTLGTGCYATHIVTVDAQAAIITPVGDTTFCPGGFVALTANTGTGFSYQWYVGGLAISGAVSSSYIASLPGSYQVGVLNSAGCYTLSIPMAVTIDTPTAAITAGSGITTICSGTSATLNANTGVGLSYQWLLSGVAIAGAVSSSYTTSNAGDYSVVVTNATGCSATSNVITISVNPSPTANIVLSGPLTFCQGSSVSMTTDFASDYVYQWYDGAGAIAGANGQSFTATAAGTYYVIVTNSYGCSATSIISTVVVNALPDVSITASGATVFCAGGSVTLSGTAVAGDTYQWYLGGTAITGATNSSYLATVGGGYQIQVTDPSTGCSNETAADTTVTVVTTPIVVPVTPASFCWGGSSLLTTSIVGAVGAVTYQWYFNGAVIPGATGALYNATVPGDYSCQITIPASCTFTTVSIPVTEYPLPNPIVTFDGTLFHTAPYYVAYQWYKDLTAIPGATSDATPAIGSGNYKVAVTDTNGCQSYADPYVYTGGSTGGSGTTAVQNVNKGDIKIYPNPAQTVVHIESPNEVRAIINSVDGRSVLNITDAKDINISDLADGIYMIMLYDSNGQMVKVEKLVKATN